MKKHGSPRALGAILAALLLAMSLLSGIALADDGTVDEEPAYRPAKQAVADSVAALMPTGDEKVDEELAKALEQLTKGLDDDLWTDDATLSDKGDKAFDADKKAVEKIQKAIDEAPMGSDLLVAALDAAVAALVDIDAAIAMGLLSAAIEVGGDTGKIAKAEKELAEALAELEDGKPDKAIEKYRKAWEEASKAIEKIVGDNGDPAGGDFDKWSEYTFWFVNIETGEMTGPLSGTSRPDDPLGYTGKSNEGYLMVGGELMQLHVSCSDAFPNGVGAKSDPTEDSPWRVDRYTISKYSNGELDKTCGLVGLIRPELSVDKAYSIDGGVTFLQGDPSEVVFTDQNVQFRFEVTNTGNVDVADVNVADDVFGALTAANVACGTGVLAAGESYECSIDAGTLAEGAHTNTATASGFYEGAEYSANDTVTFSVEEDGIS